MKRRKLSAFIPVQNVEDIIEDFENGFRSARKPRLIANQ